jgi:indolepyruvate decarboxylase
MQLFRKTTSPIFKSPSPNPTAPDENTALTYESIASVLIPSLTSGDTLVVDTGNISVVLPKFRLPQGVSYHSQTLWGSIGWATGAVVGASFVLAKKGGRAICVTGDGAHKMVIGEIGTLGAHGGKNVVWIVINNGVYGIEECLDQNGEKEYNKLGACKYSKLPEVFWCDNWLARASVHDGWGVPDSSEGGRWL